MQPRVTRMSTGQRNALRIVGAIVLLVGLGLTVTAFVDFFGAFGGSGPPTKFWMAFVGLPLVTFGIWILQLGFLRTMSELVVTETEGAIEVGSGAFGRGLGRGLQQTMTGLAAPAPVVKVKCRKCGYLESEDAKFCSQCRTAM